MAATSGLSLPQRLEFLEKSQFDAENFLNRDDLNQTQLNTVKEELTQKIAFLTSARIDRNISRELLERIDRLWECFNKQHVAVCNRLSKFSNSEFEISNAAHLYSLFCPVLEDQINAISDWSLEQQENFQNGILVLKTALEEIPKKIKDLKVVLKSYETIGKSELVTTDVVAASKKKCSELSIALLKFQQTLRANLSMADQESGF